MNLALQKKSFLQQFINSNLLLNSSYLLERERERERERVASKSNYTKKLPIIETNPFCEGNIQLLPNVTYFALASSFLIQLFQSFWVLYQSFWVLFQSFFNFGKVEHKQYDC